MPTYHYRCDQCGQHLEVVQSMTDDPITECAACGGHVQKVLKPVGIVLKGSGFYRTDSRSSSNGSKHRGRDESGSSKDDSASGDSSSESGASSTSSTSESGSSGSSSSGSSGSTSSSSSSNEAKSA